MGKTREYSDYSPHKVVNTLANQVKFSFKKGATIFAKPFQGTSPEN